MNIVRRHEQPQAKLAAPAAYDVDPFRLMRDFMRWDPFREMLPLPIEKAEAFYMPDFDVKETPQGYTFKADLPGLEEKNIGISLTGQRLTITGKREEEKKEETATYYTAERSYGSFMRAFTLPEGVDLEHVAADLKDGVLTIQVLKLPEVQPKKVPIVAEGAKAKA
jgi:HSP20 family protein